MPYREQPMDFVAGPARYPEPDWGAIATVTRVWVPDDETVGWAILQNDEALAWLSAAGPDALGYPIREHVDELLTEGAATGRPALETWNAILTATLHSTPTDHFLPATLADIRKDWGD